MNEIGTESNAVCYLCGNEGKVMYRHLTDTHFGAPGEWTLKACTGIDCGLLWLDPRPTIDDIGKAYRQYYTHGNMKDVCPSYWIRFIRAILHGMSTHLLRLHSERRRYKCMYLDKTPPGRLLEVGCGNGKRLARMRTMGWNVMGQEIDPAASEYARMQKGITVHLGPLETLDKSNEYDAIIVSHVIEHVHDPVDLLRNCHRLLKKDGLLLMLTPNAASFGHRTFGSAWRGLEPPRHLHLFTSKTLILLGKEAGFNRQRVWTTSVGAFGIGQQSRAPTGILSPGAGFMSPRDVCRGFWFQLAARWALLRDPDSGEECVLIAVK
ncbi:class I SAM-dependent methyltransferase [Nitrosomonas sp. JL21]|uniref:class I SAM-dependent methyltransferase n=1 Tax=Nitrosomonas sp. JL21 TaxID=153949 RepID=UPI001F03E769|nr:class I SAM-dependent methyltransferase [Nitrosomonas sp. JL21]